jgi:hypothetical protein
MPTNVPTYSIGYICAISYSEMLLLFLEAVIWRNTRIRLYQGLVCLYYKEKLLWLNFFFFLAAEKSAHGEDRLHVVQATTHFYLLGIFFCSGELELEKWLLLLISFSAY